MAVYHLGLFLARRKFRSTLYFGIFCFLVALRLFTTDERYLVQMLPALDWELLVKIEYLSFYLAVPVFGMFIQSLFLGDSSQAAAAGPMFSAGGFSLLVALSRRSGFFPTRLPVYELITLALMRVHLPGDAVGIRSSGSPRRSCSSRVRFCCAWRCSTTSCTSSASSDTGFFAPFGLFVLHLLPGVSPLLPADEGLHAGRNPGRRAARHARIPANRRSSTASASRRPCAKARRNTAPS
ncbi:MAG: 7TM-DISM domain-containing protein [Candidatus Moduliflexus flocculans]|nr:7TM-DISM domain-containing protein [Candidatus Moduliflexus flocculans]